MKNLKKLGALLLALTLILSLGATAFADGEATLPTGDAAGAFAEQDTPIAQNKTLRIYKSILAYNADSLDVAAPTITYSYSIEAGSAGKTVTDETSDHATGTAVSTTTLAGVVTDLTMTSQTNSTAAASTTLKWEAANDILKTGSDDTAAVTAANADGAGNKKYVDINFSNVVFGATGVYRYKLTEAIDGTDTYSASGVTDDGSNVRYLDVYVKPAATGYNNGSTAAEWEIYGYALFIEDGDVTSATAKTTGFVDYSVTSGTDTVTYGDKYYTYNVSITKNIEGDPSMVAAGHQFPFSVKFTNTAITKAVKIGEATLQAPVTSARTPAAAALPLEINSTLGADLKIGENTSGCGTIRYIGVPVGTKVEVQEKNDVAGTTYSLVTKVDTADASAAALIAYNANSAVTELAAPTANENDTVSHAVTFTNTLALISPTGVVLRVAPYVLMLAAGIVLFVLSRKRRSREEV